MSHETVVTERSLPAEAIEALEGMRRVARERGAYLTFYSEPHWASWAKPGGGWVLSYEDGVDGHGVLVWFEGEWTSYRAIRHSS